MEIAVGMRVVRGPDWKWGNQDGGEGTTGTVGEVREVGSAGDGKTSARAVVVQWDNGNRCNYRCGIDGKYDLRVLDNAPCGTKHAHIVCDVCRQNGITGIRWKCSQCYDFDLCTTCYMSGKHTLDHPFLRYDTSSGKKMSVPVRSHSPRVMAKGIYPSAEVVRGHDWLWADQDGGIGKVGKVLEIRSWQDETYRSVANIEWTETKKRNVYRCGHKGKVDLKCKELGNGGYYYPEHLPVLGAPYPPEQAHEGSKFSCGDMVKVQLELDVFRLMQDGHGGWNSQMSEVVGQLGTVQGILDSGDVRVRYPNNKMWTLNPQSITKVPSFSAGDIVRIMDDLAQVHSLQEDHGGWVDDMALSLGQPGRVAKVFPTGDVRVFVNGKTWTYNPNCLSPAPGETVPDAPEAEELDLDLHLKLLSILENPAVIVAAAAAGDVSTLKEFLQRHPKEVNSKAAGKAAIHCAAVSGNVAMVKAILEFKPDLEVQDEDGDAPLHLCAYSDEDEVAKLLLDAGANVNSKNNKGATPAIIAAVKGHFSVLRLLLDHPRIVLHEQDSDGDTALHTAVLAQKHESVSILLEKGADPTLLNFRLFTPIHEAAKIGFLPAMEQFMRRFPQHMNMKKDDGYTALHLASLNNHIDIVTALADSDCCNIDITTMEGQTALHMAVHQGHASIVERLVGFGINLDCTDLNGDTALHIALLRETMDKLSLSADTPQMKKIREKFHLDEGSSPSAVMACLLVQEGANLYVCNNKGSTPLELCSPDIATLMTTVHSGKGTFHGSLRAPASLPSFGFSKQPASEPNPPKKQQSFHKAESTDSAGPLCFVCESTVDVQFEPCKHAVMCSVCAQRAKRCPTCKVTVKTVSKLVFKCPMCMDEEAEVTLKPCDHKYCSKCARRMKICFECRTEITVKEGLRESDSEAAVEGGGESNAVCSICLTEPRNTALFCGHQLCWDCAQRVDHCPVCRKFISHRIRLFQ